MLSHREKLLSAVDGNRYSNPHLDNVQRIRNLGMLNPKWDVSIKYPPPGLENHVEEEAKGRVKCWRMPRK